MRKTLRPSVASAREINIPFKILYTFIPFEKKKKERNQKIMESYLKRCPYSPLVVDLRTLASKFTMAKTQGKMSENKLRR